MRLSRKAGALACDIRWIKYECTAEEYIKRTYYKQSAWGTSKRGTDVTKTYTGFHDYTIRQHMGEYIYVGYQPYITISVDNPGTAYTIDDHDDFWTVNRYTIDSSGNYDEAGRVIFTKYEYATRYPVGEQVGAVYFANGEYPDAKNGYTYVTVYNGYTIMKDSDRKYFAYEKA